MKLAEWVKKACACWHAYAKDPAAVRPRGADALRSLIEATKANHIPSLLTACKGLLHASELLHRETKNVHLAWFATKESKDMTEKVARYIEAVESDRKEDIARLEKELFE